MKKKKVVSDREDAPISASPARQTHETAINDMIAQTKKHSMVYVTNPIRQSYFRQGQKALNSNA